MTKYRAEILLVRTELALAARQIKIEKMLKTYKNPKIFVKKLDIEATKAWKFDQSSRGYDYTMIADSVNGLNSLTAIKDYYKRQCRTFNGWRYTYIESYTNLDDAKKEAKYINSMDYLTKIIVIKPDIDKKTIMHRLYKKISKN